MSVGIPQIAQSYDGEPVSVELPPLVAELRAAVLSPAVDLDALTRALRSVLEFLASPRGRTNANCWTVDRFCMNPETWDERGFEHLPPALADILGDMGGALHDTVQAPEIAENFDSTPEQMLARLEKFSLDAPPV